VVSVVVLAGTAAFAMWAFRGGAGDEAGAVARPASLASFGTPALTVTVTSPRLDMLPITVSANGTIMAWQEASIGAEANGLRLVAVNVNVGDVVRRGQVLAVFESDTVAAELAQTHAAVAEAEAALDAARDDAERSDGLRMTGAMSEQQIRQYGTAERTARARLEATQAAERTQQLRLAQTQVLASDDGVISARTATVGAVLPPGQELFRLIRRGRLEWRAEIAASDLAKVKPGQVAHVTPVGGEAIRGTLRMVSPTVDTQTRNGLVYVDLPTGTPARAGMFARGELEIRTAPMMTLPQRAVLLRDGFSYVMRVGPDSRVTQSRVTVGRRVSDRIEIIGGIEAWTRVVASGAAFLDDGDLVRLVEDPSAREGGDQVPDPAAAKRSSGGTR
jgi:RND family efflux transporter MFP subunit